MKGKIILAVILGTVCQFLLGWLVYGIILMDFMESSITHYEGLMAEEGPGTMLGYVINSLAIALLLAFIILRGKVSAKQGAICGVVATLLMGISINIMFYFGWNLATGWYYVVDILAFAIMTGITGALMGYLMSRKQEDTAAQTA